MAVTTNVPSSNTTASFAAQVTWSLTPAAPSISVGGTSGSDSISATASVSSSSGTFSISSVKGTRTSTNTYSASNQVKVTFTASNASWARNNCNVYFNTSSSGSSWSNVASSASVQIGGSKTLALQLSNTSVSSMNGRYFSASVNMGYSTTTQYSLDNSTWQNSGNFSGLTPNTTYTVYVRAYTTSASGNSSSYGYSSKSFALGSKPDNLQILCTARTKNSLSMQVSAGNMSGSGSSYELYYAPKNSQTWTKLSLGSQTTVNITGLMPSTEYKFFLKATNAVGTTISVNLPDEYTPLDYIQGTGTQYIKTGYMPQYNAQITSDFQYTTISPQQQIIFGSYGNLVSAIYINSSNMLAYSWNNNSGSWTSSGYSANTNRHVVTLDGLNGKIIYDGSSSNMAGTHTQNATQELYIMHINKNGVPGSDSEYARARLYDWYAIENDSIIHRLVPCKNSNNVAGMYDVLTDTFYENAGTGTFTQGSEIENYQAIYTTLEDIPGGLWIKVGADWVVGQPYIKMNGVWNKCAAVYYKTQDGWEQAKLYD